MAEGKREELGWPYPPGSTSEEREGGGHLFRIAPPTPEYVERVVAAISADPTDLKVRQMYARVLSGRGEHEEALRECESILRLEPENRRASTMAASCLRELGRATEAVELCRKALAIGELHPTSEAITRWGLAEALHAAGSRREAILELSHAVRTLEDGLRRRAASPSLLRQLRELLSAWQQEGEE